MMSALGHIFLSFLTTPVERMMSSAMLNVVEDLAKKGRKTLMLVLGSFVLSVFLAAGVLMSLIEMASQLDKGGSINFSAMLTMSLGLVVISVLILAVLFWPKEKMKPAEPVHHEAPRHHVDELISTVVSHGVDYFKNRDFQKARSRNYSRA